MFPRESLNAIAELGLLGLLVPKELGGLGETHLFAAVIVETIARYGCPSTAMVYGECTGEGVTSRWCTCVAVVMSDVLLSYSVFYIAFLSHKSS